MPNVTHLTLEQHLVYTFSKVQDQYGQKLDITSALPTLEQVLKGPVDPTKKYDFIGEAVCQFSIRCILARTHSHLTDPILDAVAKKFRSLTRLNKLLIKELGLKQRNEVIVSQNTAQLIAGVLYSFFGAAAVEKYIENAVLHIVALELGEATKALLPSLENPIQTLNQMISKAQGTIDVEHSQRDNVGTIPQWQVVITARLNPTSTVFKHERIEPSIQKAKTAVYQDVLTYLEKNPEEYTRLTLPNATDIINLPIGPEEYTIIYPTKRANTSNSSNYNNGTSTVADIDEFFHVPVGENDTIHKLQALLLGNPMDTSDENENGGESPTKKRARETGVDGMFSSGSGEHTPDQIVTTTSQLHFTLKSPISPPTPPNPSNRATEHHPFNGSLETKAIHPRVFHYFKTIFRNNRSTLALAFDNPGQSKSTFLSIVLQHDEKIKCDSETNQVGSSHAPLFDAVVRLQSKEYSNVFITTEGASARKKDAERRAFHKLCLLFK